MKIGRLEQEGRNICTERIVYSLIPDHVARKFASPQKLSEDPFLHRVGSGGGSLGLGWVLFLSGDPITWNKGGVGHAASGSMEEYFRRSNSLERQTYRAKINHSHNYNPPSCQDVVLHVIILPSRGSVLNSM